MSSPASEPPPVYSSNSIPPHLSRLLVLALLGVVAFSGCCRFRPPGTTSPAGRYDPIDARVLFMTVSEPEPVTLPFVDIGRTFGERLEYLFSSVIPFPPGLREDVGGRYEADALRKVQEAREAFLVRHDLEVETIRGLVSDTESEYFGVLLIRTYGQKWDGLKKVTEVGLSFVLYNTEDGQMISRRSSYVVENDSFRGETYDTALERAIYEVLKATFKDLRSQQLETNVFMPPPQDAGEWLQRRWKVFWIGR